MAVLALSSYMYPKKNIQWIVEIWNSFATNLLITLYKLCIKTRNNFLC